MGQEFDKSQQGWLVCVPQCLESQLRRCKWLGVTWTAGNWDHLEAPFTHRSRTKAGITWKQNSAVTVIWGTYTWPLFEGFLAAWCLGFERECPQERAYQEEILRELGRSSLIFYTLLYKLYCFICHFPLVNVVTNLPRFIQKGI